MKYVNIMIRSRFHNFKYFHILGLFVFSVFAFNVGCSNPFATANTPDQIRLGTFNLQNFDGLNTAKVDAVSQIIERNFDVIGLQEVSPVAAEKLKEKLNKSQKWNFILGESGNKQRVALFYRQDEVAAQKVTEWKQVNITGTLRSPLVTYIKAGQKFDFTLVIVHQKGSGGAEADRLRRQQSDLLRKEVDQYQKNSQSLCLQCCYKPNQLDTMKCLALKLPQRIDEIYSYPQIPNVCVPDYMRKIQRKSWSISLTALNSLAINLFVEH